MDKKMSHVIKSQQHLFSRSVPDAAYLWCYKHE